MKTLARCVKAGGVGRVLVMPNLSPPITSSHQAESYLNELKECAPETEFLMTLFLSESLTMEDLEIAKSKGVTGVKSYPKGVTTGSSTGVEHYEFYYPIFAKMTEIGLVLHLHGEMPGECVMTAEESFLKELKKIHSAFPNLKIVLEHVSSAAGVEAVKGCGETVAATITAHHLDLTIDEVVGNPLNFCKPVAKYENDRSALRQVVADGHSRFFLGSDSAPHPVGKKVLCGCAAAGVFTQPFLLAYLADTLDSLGCLHRLKDFACVFGAKFFGLKINQQDIVTLVKEDFIIPNEFICESGDIVIPYRHNQTLKWRIQLS